MKEKRLGRGLGDILTTLGKVIPKPALRPAEELIPSRLEEPARQIITKQPLEEKVQTPIPLKKEIFSPSPAKIDTRPSSENTGVISLRIDDIIPNRFQPRKEFDPEGLKELTESIKTTGVIQPVLVRVSGSQYELIAGERRWRACRLLETQKIPAIIKEADDKTLLEWAIIENTQRKDLSPMERGRAYKELVEVFKLTHDEVAKRMGLERSTISNFIRLLDLPREVQEEVSRGTITMGHARSLLSLDNREIQIKLALRIKKEGMSVRRLEYVIRYLKRRRGTLEAKPATDQTNLILKELEDRLRRKFGTKISITSYKLGGYIKIDFYSNDDFQRILEMLEK